MVFDKGSIYGVTNSGGAQGQGEVFRLDPGAGNTWTETTLYSFAGGSDGSDPVGIAFGAGGEIIGATDTGGGAKACGSGCGTVFELVPSGWSEKIIHVFKGGTKDGELPKAAPLVRNGIVYLSTAFGGAGNGFGTVMQFKPPAPQDELDAQAAVQLPGGIRRCIAVGAPQFRRHEHLRHHVPGRFGHERRGRLG